MAYKYFQPLNMWGGLTFNLFCTKSTKVYLRMRYRKDMEARKVFFTFYSSIII